MLNLAETQLATTESDISLVQETILSFTLKCIYIHNFSKIKLAKWMMQKKKKKQLSLLIKFSWWEATVEYTGYFCVGLRHVNILEHN